MSRRIGSLARGVDASALLFGLAGVAVLALGAPAAGAAGTATLFASPAGTGTTCSSTKPCPIATAVNEANSGFAGDAVTIHLAGGTYSATHLAIDVHDLSSLSLVGSGTSGSGASDLHGTGHTLVVSVTTGTVSLTSLQVTDHATTGGCILDDTVLSLSHVSVSDCTATYGGGINVEDDASLAVSTSSVSTDTATVWGGGIYSEGTVTLTKVTMDHDTAKSRGGALMVTGPKISTTISGSTFVHDHATSSGGGIEITQGTAAITGSTISTDSADDAGGLASFTRADVTVTGSTLAHDTASSAGGAVQVATGAALHLSSSVVSNDTADQGGGIVNWTTATATITGSTFSTDNATQTGGAIFDDYHSPLTVAGSTFSTDQAAGGGAIALGTHTATGHVSGSLFRSDSAETGGAVVLQRHSTLTLTTSTATGTSASWGGVLDSFGATATLSRDTFAGDKADSGDGGAVITEKTGSTTVTNSTLATDSSTGGTGMGGAVASTSGSTTSLVDDTLAHDTAVLGGGGFLVAQATGSVADSIFSSAGCQLTSATYTDKGHNVASTNSCHLGATSISTSSTIDLGPLAANTSKGPETMVVAPKSSAFEVVPAAACTVNTTERGLPRPGAATKNCDAGAFEYQLTGYDLVGSDGGVFVFNPPGVVTKGFYGSLPGIHVIPNKPVVGIVPTLSDAGYFLVAEDGGVFAFGNAPFLGSLPGIKVTPNLPIVGIVAANTDKGYFLVGADGGVYAFGTVPFLGSLPGTHVSVSNVIGIAATPTGSGYWVVQATGKVTAFGTAQAFTTLPTTSAVTSIAGTPTGGGYWLSTKEGGVYPYGNAQKQGKGTLPAINVTPNLPVIGIVRVADTVGYWLIGQDGGIFAFGTAPFVGSLPGLSPPVHVTNIVGAVPN